MSEPLPTPEKISDLERELRGDAGGRSRDETLPAAGDRDSALLALVCAMLALGALAVYKLADAIATACWACG